MVAALQTIANERDRPIYISIEPTPDCYELEPGDVLTLLYDAPPGEEAFSIYVVEEGLSLSPLVDEFEVLINGASAEGRSWKFKHYTLRKMNQRGE